jgi:hypothetical protein
MGGGLLGAQCALSAADCVRAGERVAYALCLSISSYRLGSTLWQMTLSADSA